jgi:RND family efflux transporter MFP subunit
MRQLQWGSGWLEVLLRRGHGDSSEYTRKRLAFLVSLLSSYLDQTDMHAAINAIVTELATFLECDRVTIGMRYRRELRLLALSHSAQFDPHSNLARALEATMQEAIDQEVNLTYPAPETAPLRVTQAHARLAHGFDSSAIATIVVRAREQTVGALVFERAAARPFEKPALALMEGAAALLGPVLEMQRVAELPLAAQVRLRLARAWKELSGPHGGAGKLALAAVLILAVVGIFGKGDQRVSAETTIEGSVQRVLAAPFNGFISEVSARPGDAVHAGQVIARLDDRDLRLERLKVLAQREERDNLYREALAGHDRAQIGITAAQLAQAQAQLDLLDEQLRRTEVVAPFDGVIVKGDLAHALGEPIEKGQTLVEVAPLGTYRVVLEVDEHDIAALAPGEQGQLTLASLPGVQFPFVVSKITPVNTAREGRNFFRVEAQLQGGTERLRPGMEGIAKVVVAHRRYFSIWTHDLFNWVRLWIWSWMP